MFWLGLIGFFGVAMIHAGWQMNTTSIVDILAMGIGLLMVLKAASWFIWELVRFLERESRSD